MQRRTPATADVVRSNNPEAERRRRRDRYRQRPPAAGDPPATAAARGGPQHRPARVPSFAVKSPQPTAPDAGLTSRLPTDSSSDTEQCASRESFCRVTFRSSQLSPSGALTVARRAARAAAGGDWTGRGRRRPAAPHATRGRRRGQRRATHIFSAKI